MTIRYCINAAALNTQLGYLERCTEEAPDGAYEHAKALRALIGETADRLMADLRALGYQADNCDLIREVEAVIYGYVKDSNPERSDLITAEGFGEHIDGPAGQRVRQQAADNIAALRKLGIVPAAAA